METPFKIIKTDSGEMWLNNIKPPNYENLTTLEIYNKYYVCEKHFSNDCIVAGTRRGLKRTAVPTLHIPGLEIRGTEENFPTKKARTEHIVLETKVSTHDEPMATSAVQEQDIPGPSHVRTPSPLSPASSVIGSSRTLCKRAITTPVAQTYRKPVQGAPNCLILAGFPICRPGREKLTYESRARFFVKSRLVKTAFRYLTDILPVERDQLFPAQRPGSKDCKSQSPKRLALPHEVIRRVRKRKLILREVNVSRAVDLTPKARKLYRIVTDWGVKMARMQRNVSSFQSRLAIAEKCVNSPDFKKIFKQVNESTYHLILCQIRNQQLCPKEKMSLQERCCIIMFDELALECTINYNKKQDCIMGLEDTGSDRKAALAGHANVFLVKGLYKQWKQPVCFTFSSGPVKTLTLKQMINTVITECQTIGLDVVASVCDQGSANRAAINSLLKDVSEECIKTKKENKHFGWRCGSGSFYTTYHI
ncbi:hypothetical protein NQ317_000791 [Molorchus minor]|uniref:THAP-type domain-containing protein n=1 Tax=Molorchus minor TaxID=1323400 RepID=A0ABQ9J4Y4_9CUCU|nr:hypothetical protein NQ317_000791 [Molorchus minor]